MKLKERFIEWFSSLWPVRWFLEIFAMVVSVIFVLFLWRVTQRVIDHNETLRHFPRFNPNPHDPFAYERIMRQLKKVDSMTEQPAKELNARNLADLFGALNWGADFTIFCEHLALEPGTSQAREKWRQFQLLCNGFAAFDVENVARLINLARHLESKQNGA